MDPLKQLRKTQEHSKNLKKEISKIIIGQEEIVNKLLIALFSQGHVLLIGVPGLAKTLLIKTLSQAMDMDFKRIQFTPDLMPSDITGTEVIEEDMSSGKREFRYIKGPIFANIILADEINRTPPKTQSALLEAMQEYHVTSAGTTHDLPLPFFVLATQNPIEQEGTYPLPEAQLDRFMFDLRIDYPDLESERRILESNNLENKEIDKNVTRDDIMDIQRFIHSIPVSDNVRDFTLKLVRHTRPSGSEISEVKQYVNWGAGPRAGQYLILGAKAKAAMEGRATPDISDIKYLANDVLRHRIILNFSAESDHINIQNIIDAIYTHIDL